MLEAAPSAAARVAGLIRAEALRDRHLGLHERRVATICFELCGAIGLDHTYAVALRTAAELHDIGKLAMSDAVLEKHGPLSDEERAIVQMHSRLGHDILAGTGNDLLDLAASLALYHHERFDGSGYPDNLSGESIPLGARIVAVSDVYEAIRSPRPYKPAVGHEAAAAAILKGDGRTAPHQFDPKMLDAFTRCQERIAEIYSSQDPAP